MLRLPRPTNQERANIQKLQAQLEAAVSRINETEDSNEQATLLSRTEALEHELNISRSRHLILGARSQGVEIKPGWLATRSDSEWLTSEGRDAVENALRRRRAEDWLKLIPMIISTIAIMVSVASAIATSRFSQQKDFMLNRSWLAGNELISCPLKDLQTQLVCMQNMSLRIANNGRAPALHAVIVAYAIPGDSDQSIVKSDVTTACSTVSKVSSNGDFVPPGASLTILVNPFIRNSPQTSPNKTSPLPSLILGCIGYEDSLDHKRHATSFGFRSDQIHAEALQRVTAMPKMKIPNDEHDSGDTLVWTPYSLGYGIAY